MCFQAMPGWMSAAMGGFSLLLGLLAVLAVAALCKYLMKS